MSKNTFYSSGSMEPAFHRGDLLLLTHEQNGPIYVGDIVVFKIEGREIPIVHRVLKVHQKYDNMLKPIILNIVSLLLYYPCN